MSSRRMRGLVVFSCCLLFAAAPHLLAQNENETVGFQTNHLFESGAFGENIDILNGNLTLSTPIGPGYQLNQNLGYQPVLSYASKIWDRTEIENTQSVMRRGAGGLGHILHFGRIYRDVAFVSQQRRRATGELYTTLDYQCTWHYVTPDGNEHVLPGTASPFQGLLTCIEAPLNPFTIDNTFFKLDTVTGTLSGWDGSGTAPTLAITTPDKIRYTFGHFIQVHTGTGGRLNAAIHMPDPDSDLRRYNRDFGGWYVTQIEDLRAPGRAYVNIAYDQRPGFQHLIQGITDSAQRTIAITNECQAAAGTPSGCQEMSLPRSCTSPSQTGCNRANRPSTRIASIRVPAFGGSTSPNPAAVAHYDLGYQWKEVQDITGSGVNSWQNVLRTITYPSVTKASGGTERYVLSMDYSVFGEVTTRSLPTGATVTYDFGDYQYLSVGLSGHGYNPQARSRAVRSKSINVDGRVYGWTYTRVDSYTTNPPIVMVTDPFGNDTLYYYHSSLRDSRDQLGSCDEDGWAPEWNDGLNYRIEYYQGSGGNRKLVRAESREYDADTGPACALGSRTRKNVRTTRSVTTYVDHGGRQRTMAYSDWDGRGHWRVQTETGSDVTGARVTRAEYLDHDPGRFLFRELSDGARVISRTDNVYAGLNLILSIVRLTLPPRPGTGVSSVGSPGDIFTGFSYDADGNVDRKEIGDAGATCNSWLTSCQVTNPRYRIQYGWQAGRLASKAFYNRDVSNPGFYPWKAIDRDRDANTGQIFISRDTAGVPNNYDYDELGRLRKITPPSPEHPTEIEYADVRHTTVRQGPVAVMGGNYSCAPTSGNFIASCYEYDGLGRLVKTQKRPFDLAPGNPYQITQYDIAGRTTFVSEWLWPAQTTCAGLAAQDTCPRTAAPAGCGTTFDLCDPLSPTQTDPFGRTRKVTTADGKMTETSYFGENTRVTVNGIEGVNGPFSAATTYFRDVWGRLTKVETPPPGGADALYAYDLRDNLVQVDLINKQAPGRQVRLFEYDPLGRFRWSWNPESGVSEVIRYDPLGNVMEQADAAGNHLVSTFDGAARLVSVSRWAGSDPSVVREVLRNTYDQGEIIGPACTQNLGFGCSAGRLTNITDNDDNGSLLMGRTLRYTGLNGRLSSQSPTFAGYDSVGFVSYTYNAFGLPERTVYPEGPIGKGGAFSIEHLYANGYLTGVRDAQTLVSLATLRYNAAGGIETVRTQGDVETRVAPDERNRPRKITIGRGVYGPASDQFSLGTHYQSGQYQYDGAGNISAIGQSSYRYDGANRLVLADELVFGDAIRRKHVYQYDDYGNMTRDEYWQQTTRMQFDMFTMDPGGRPNLNQVGDHYREIVDPQTLNTAMSTRILAYDPRGNLVRGDDHLFTYDHRNRMTGLRTIQGNRDVARYAYDGSSSRIRKDDAQRGVTTLYVRGADGALLSEFRRPRAVSGIPEWSKHYILAGGRLLAMRENRVPGPVGGLSATTSSGRVNLSWLANLSEDGVTSYKVYRAGSFAGPWTALTTTSSLTYQDRSVSDGSWYHYAVTAVNTVEGYASARLVVQANSSTVPQAPTGLVGRGGDRRVDLSWVANAEVDYVVGYRVYRDGATSPLNSVLITPTYFTDYLADLNPPADQQPHSYVVKAVNAWGLVSPASASVTATPRDGGRPAPPRDVSAIGDCESGNPRISVRWVPPYGSTDVVRYDLFRSPEFPVAGCSANCVKSVSNRLEYQDPDVVAGQDYRYWVVAVDGAGNTSGRSAAVWGTPRNVSSALQIPEAPIATAGDGRVVIRVTYAHPIVYPKQRLYRRENARHGCETLQMVAEIATASGGSCDIARGVCYKDHADQSVSNGVAYDYIVTNANAGGVESGYSRAALAIPVPAPLAFSECVEELRSTDYADFVDGAEKHVNGQLRRLRVRALSPGIPEWQPLTASTAEGTVGFLKGYHLYNHNIPWGVAWNGDIDSFDPLPIDLVKGECVVDTGILCSGVAFCPEGQTCDSINSIDKRCRVHTGTPCHQDSNCEAGQVCRGQSLYHCAYQTDRWCQSDRACDSVSGDYCTREAAISGYCQNATTQACLKNEDCPVGSDPAQRFCRNAHPVDGYLNRYAHGGFNTFTNSLSPFSTIEVNGCVTLKSVYSVYANGRWLRVESSPASNIRNAPATPGFRCLQSTPSIYEAGWDDVFPGCAAASDPPPQPLSPPAVAASAGTPNSITVSWQHLGVCKPKFYDYCGPCGPSFCVQCPTWQPLICVADPVYNPVYQAGGHCVLPKPVQCTSDSDCVQGYQVCETGGVDGYHVYATERRVPGTGPATYPRHHFLPNVPAAAVNAATTSVTFENLAPTYGGGAASEFSFRVAAFSGSRTTLSSPPSAWIRPAMSAAAVPAPQGVKIDIYTTGGVRLEWLPGGVYADFAHYQVARSAFSGGPYGPVGTTTLTNYNDATAPIGTDWHYVIRAVTNGGAASAPSVEVVSRALPAAPDALQPLSPPRQFSAEAVPYLNAADKLYIGLSWCPNGATEGVTGYRIYRSKKPGGPYALVHPVNKDVSPLCLDGKHRCEITESGGAFLLSNPATTCTSIGKHPTCRLLDKSVQTPPLNNDYPAQVKDYVYYYVATAVKRDPGTGAIVEESAYSVENQGWPNYGSCNNTYYCDRYDPDVLPKLPCDLPDSASLAPPDSDERIACVDRPGSDSETGVAPYRVIGGDREASLSQPIEDPILVQPMGRTRPPGGGDPPPSSPLPTPNAVVRLAFYHLDHLGSPRVVTDSTGQVLSTHRYMPFGDERPVSGSSNTRQFTGHERDKESGLDYMMARYYSSSLARFMAVDPGDDTALEDPQSWNPYAYVRNNPIRGTDPTGMAVDWSDPSRTSADVQHYPSDSNEDTLKRMFAEGWAKYLGGDGDEEAEKEAEATPLDEGTYVHGDSSGHLVLKLVPKAIIWIEKRALPRLKKWLKGGSKAIKKPKGVPDDWIVKPSDRGGGTKYVNPRNDHDSVRVMPGNPNSPNPAQQRPYVIRMKDGKAVDAGGRRVSPRSAEAHIPLEQFRFDP